MLAPMTDSTDDLPDDIERLKAMLLAERSEKARLANQNERLLHMLRQLRRNHFGRKSERLSEDQLNLGLEDLETAIASGEAAVEKADATLTASRRKARKVNRGHLPSHLPREEIVIEPASKTCPCCGNDLHVIGEDRSERLDKIPAKYRVIVTRRPKYACRSCERTGADETAGVIQAPAPARLVEGGLPTEALVADVVVSQIRVAPAAVPSVADDGSRRDRHRSFHARPLGRLRGVRAAARLRPAGRDPEKLHQALRRRDTLPRPRSRPRQDQDRLPVGHRPR